MRKWHFEIPGFEWPDTESHPKCALAASACAACCLPSSGCATPARHPRRSPHAHPSSQHFLPLLHRCRYPTGQECQAYIERYADATGLRQLIKFGVEVTGLVPRSAAGGGAPDADGSRGWLVEWAGSNGCAARAEAPASARPPS